MFPFRSEMAKNLENALLKSLLEQETGLKYENISIGTKNEALRRVVIKLTQEKGELEKSYNSRISALKGQLVDSDRELEKLWYENKEQEEKTIQLEKEMDLVEKTSKSNVQAKVTQITQMRERIARKNAKINDSEAEIKDLKLTVSGMKVNYDYLQEKVDNLERQIRIMESTISDNEQARVDLTTEKDDLITERDKHREACETFKSTIKEQLKKVVKSVNERYEQMLENKENLPIDYNDRMLRCLRRKRDKIRDFLEGFDEMDAPMVCNHFQASVCVSDDF